ncbi:glutathione S-transferase family protein [Sinorhizobium mexicanum]|uniref:glutathione S-transferase family protein n=1 Tax=Sinorhizobium mexicanum TaxID=375549 RepID=UPI001D794CAA|nr:glutathione S-transferase N-terminal domain-containing protein [Sinorhizobium mexicanum]MBP1887672.1 hypothetical protein [Sinorhizobium mexicanum]
MYILHGGDFTRAPLVQWVLEEGKIAYEFRRIDILNGEHRSAEFLAMNPAGLVPVLVTPEGMPQQEAAGGIEDKLAKGTPRLRHARKHNGAARVPVALQGTASQP